MARRQNELGTQNIRTSRAWSYEPSTQTAVAQTIWQEFDANGQGIDRWQKEPVRLHCVFRFEMEHLFARTGFDFVALYGDFFRQALQHGHGLGGAKQGKSMRMPLDENVGQIA